LSTPSPDNGFGHGALVDEMRAGCRDAHATIRDNIDKAKANITAGTWFWGS